MRNVSFRERSKHGCWYCRDMVKKCESGQMRCYCTHRWCPYHKELAEYDSFEEYFQENSGDPMFLKHLFAEERWEKERGKGYRVITYKVTNLANGKVYIGKTKRSLEDRWKQHCRDANTRIACFKLQQAINKYGAEKFKIEQIDCAETGEEANAKEVYWIGIYNAIEDGYNTSPGGKAGGNYKKVMVVETGQVFNSITDAANAFGVTRGSVRQAVMNPKWRCCGLHWKKVDE